MNDQISREMDSFEVTTADAIRFFVAMILFLVSMILLVIPMFDK